MSNVSNIGDMMALSCDCGSVHYNLLKSNRIECASCGNRFGNWRKYEAQPLSDDVVCELIEDYHFGTMTIGDFVRHVEKAHGIG